VTLTVEHRYSMTDHCCRHCLGRILVRRNVYVCSVCEVESQGRPTGICACGMTAAKDAALPAGLRNAYRCGINPDRSGINPARIVVLYGGKPAQPLGSS
jgi:hypothetical protein